MALPDPVEREEASAIIDAVTAVDGVAGLSSDYALFYPGERVEGLQLTTEDRLVVHVIVDLAALGEESLQSFADRVRARAEQVAGRSVDVHVSDAQIN